MVRSVGQDAGTSRNRRIRTFGAVLVAFAFLVSARSNSAQQDAKAVRSAFVYNLIKYVQWPQSKRIVVIAFIGDHSTGLSMKETLEPKLSDGRTLRVLLNPSDSELLTCDIVYVTSDETANLSFILPRLSRTPLLTIGEDDRFPRIGGMIGLVRSGDRIQIEVNLGALHRAGLKMSSRLLGIATIVSSKEPME